MVGSGNWPTAPASADRDYVTMADPGEMALGLAQRFHGRAFAMDTVRHYWRLVAPHLPIVDLAPVAGEDIGVDLSRRDFTMNAVAATLPDYRPLLDPFRGLVDLQHGLIRQVSPQSLLADPLRVLRGLRLAAEHRFVIETRTYGAMRIAGPGLANTKPERIRTELLRALQGPGWQQAATACLDLELWAHLPVRPALRVSRAALLDRLEALARRIATAARVASRMGGLGGIDAPRAKALAALAAACLAADLDGESTRRLGEQLRFSSRESSALAAMVTAAPALRGAGADPRRAYALFEQHRAASAWAAALAGNDDFFAAADTLDLPGMAALPDGRELAGAVGRPPGPWLGQLVDHLRRAVALGELAPADAAGEAICWEAQRRRSREIDEGE